MKPYIWPGGFFYQRKGSHFTTDVTRQFQELEPSLKSSLSLCSSFFICFTQRLRKVSHQHGCADIGITFTCDFVLSVLCHFRSWRRGSYSCPLWRFSKMIFSSPWWKFKVNVSKEDTVWEDRQGLVRWYDVFKQMPLLTYQLPNLVRYGVPLPIAFTWSQWQIAAR